MERMEMDILGAAERILAYGPLGLALLMAYLGYRLLRAEVGVIDRPPSGLNLLVICFFLIVSITLMVVAGLLETYRKPMELVVHFPHSIPEDIDPPKIKVGSNTQHPDRNSDVIIKVREEQQVLVILESLVKAIEELRKTAVLQAKSVSNPDDIGIVDEN